MNKVKPYSQIEQDNNMLVSEPIAVYNSSYLQGLKSRLLATIESSTDVAMLEQCLGLFQQNDMPCVYTDEEFRVVLADAEASGYITHADAMKEFEKWGFVK